MGFSEPVSFVGDPAKTGSGAQACFEQFLSVSKNSTVPEGAWAFIKLLLSEEAQVEATQHAIDGPEGIPVLKSALSSEIETAMHPEDVDRFAPISQECADGYLALINSIACMYISDLDIYNIVTEDAPPYYLGQKSAQDVAAVMESRIQILLDERK